MLKKHIILLPFFLLLSCEKTKVMDYFSLIEIPLGFKINELGSNLPILKSYKNRQGFADNLLLDIPELTVHQNKLYIADSYNRRVSVFALKQQKFPDPILTIVNKHENYSFERPYKIFVDCYNNIYVLASIEDIESYEVQNYNNQTAELDKYKEFKKNITKIPNKNFYIYKFSPKGIFLYRIGFDGIDKEPMPYPKKISGDAFGNIYINFIQEMPNREFYQITRRYSNNGIFNFELNTQFMNMNTNINNISYKGTILSIDNYIHNEQLLILTEFQPTTDSENKPVPPIIDNIWSSVNVYSLLLNDFTKEVFKTLSITESILGVDEKGTIFFQSYDEKKETLKIHILDSETHKESFHYAPIHSSYYVLSNYFIDSKGNIYNYIIDRQEKFILLQWNTGLDKKEKKKKNDYMWY